MFFFSILYYFTISNWERGDRDIPDSIIKLICKTWDVDYYWLTEGFNQPFLQFPDDIIDDMTRRYSMSDEESYILKSYVNLDEEDRTAIQNILKNSSKKPTNSLVGFFILLCSKF